MFVEGQVMGARNTRLGPHTATVDALLKWIDSGELLRFGKPLSGPFIPISDFKQALELAQGWVASVADWTEIRDNADASLYEIGLLDTPAWLPYKKGIKELLSLIGDKVVSALPSDYSEIIDDVIGDLHTCVLCLAVHGRLDTFHDRLWAAYSCGGWPCGCTGKTPKPFDSELVLQGTSFYVFWQG